MLGIARLAVGSKFVSFNLDAILYFRDTSTSGVPRTKISFDGASAQIEIAFPYETFQDIYLRYKRGALGMNDFAKDPQSNPITGLVQFHN